MTLILLSWLYILFTAIAFGIGFIKLFQLQVKDIVITSILGLFSITILASIFALFGPINFVFNFILLVFSFVIINKHKEQFFLIFKKVKIQFIDFLFPVKLLFILSSVLILAQSATLPFIIDNETYYIQTIKWLNEYGFVPGLANLHLFFGQTSGWHIAQSVYSFSFLYNRFNDLNGCCFIIVNYWAFLKLHSYFSTNNRLDLVFGLLPLTYVFLFQFISAPSPDFAVYVFGIILFSLYLEREDFIVISAISVFLVFIKITAVVLLLLPILLLFKNYKEFKNKLASISIICGVTFIILLLKNSILTGYPLFPLTFIALPEINYGVPIEIMTFFFSHDMMHSFYMPFGTLENVSIIEILKKYFFSNGIDSIIGIASLFIVIISPFFILKKYKKQNIKSIYFVFILLLALLVYSSPQYRFYVYFTIFFVLLLLASLLNNKKVILGFLSISLTLVTILIFVPMSFSNLTDNKSLATNNTFNLRNCLIPEPNSKLNQKYLLLIIGNMKYYSPNKPIFFWITGNGKLPCINEEQLNYFETNFNIFPQMRGTNLGDGFCSQKIIPNE
jgi:hypothetical protein